MTTVTEVAPDVFRISTWVPEAGLEFAQFVVRDDEPVLFHTGMRALFPAVREAVAKVIDPATLRWISFSHFEADECGALNEWLAVAPTAQAACSVVGANVSVNDFAARPARGLAHREVIATGRNRFMFLQTPHVPHCWEAGLLFEETHKTLFCSDLFQQGGEREPLTHSEILSRHRDALIPYQQGSFMNPIAYTQNTEPTLRALAALEPTTLATMHGSVYVGDGAAALRDLAAVWKEIYDKVALPAG
ncbi:MAG: MBL fold metallo-hydrolase [Candidatus Binataceae bacterium]